MIDDNDSRREELRSELFGKSRMADLDIDRQKRATARRSRRAKAQNRDERGRFASKGSARKRGVKKGARYANVGKRDVGMKERERLADKGQTFRGTSYPVKGMSDLMNAIQAFGRAKESDRMALKLYLLEQANRLNASDQIKSRIKALGG